VRSSIPSVILECLDEAFPERPLTPPNAVERATMRAWLRFFEEVPMVAVRFPSFNQVFVHFYGRLSEEQFSEQADARPLRKHFYRRLGRVGFSQKDVDEALERFRVTVNALRTSPWLLGERLTLADFCVAPLVDRMDDLGHSALWADSPGFARWLQRIRAHPGARPSILARDCRPNGGLPVSGSHG